MQLSHVIKLINLSRTSDLFWEQLYKEQTLVELMRNMKAMLVWKCLGIFSHA